MITASLSPARSRSSTWDDAVVCQRSFPSSAWTSTVSGPLARVSSLGRSYAYSVGVIEKRIGNLSNCGATFARLPVATSCEVLDRRSMSWSDQSKRVVVSQPVTVGLGDSGQMTRYMSESPAAAISVMALHCRTVTSLMGSAVEPITLDSRVLPPTTKKRRFPEIAGVLLIWSGSTVTVSSGTFRIRGRPIRAASWSEGLLCVVGAAEGGSEAKAEAEDRDDGAGGEACGPR